MSTPRLWLIGCGNMAGAMLSRWIESGTVDPADVDVVNRGDRALPGNVRQARDLPDGPLPDMVMLGMKPQGLGEIAERFAARLADVPVLVSILAGVETATLAARFPGPAIVRAMPNLPVARGKGVVGLHGADRPEVEALMRPLGLVERIADERLSDAVTALAGSGPAFLYRFIDALAVGGAALGLPADQAARLALATVEGAADLAARADVSPGALAERVASPGGSTRSGLNVLDADGALADLLARTLDASCRRNAEMAAAAR
jgi:pyrroline-5-carboxylate reductase